MKQFWGALQQPYEVCSNYIPVLQMMKLRAQDLPGVQWLRVCLLMQGTWVWSLAGELKTHMPRGNYDSGLQWEAPQ